MPLGEIMPTLQAPPKPTAGPSTIPNTQPAYGGSPYTASPTFPGFPTAPPSYPGGVNPTAPKPTQAQSYAGMDPMTRLLTQQLNGLTGDEYQAGVLYQNQIAQAGALRDFNASALNTAYGFDSRLMGESRYQDVDLRRQLENQLYRNDLAGFGNQYMNIARLDDLAGRGYGNQQQDLAQLLGRVNRERQGGYATAGAGLGLAGQRLDLGLANNKFVFDAQGRRVNSDATGRGSMLSAGYRDSRAELANQLNLSDRDSRLGYQGSVNDYDASIRGIENNAATGMDAYNTGQRDAALGYDRALGDNAYAHDQVQNQEAQRKIENRSQNQMIDSIAKEYGIKSEQLKFTLSNGIDRLGIDLQQTLTALARDFNSENAQRRATAQMLAGQIIQVGQMSANQATTLPKPATTSTSTASSGPTLNIGSKPITAESPYRTADNYAQGFDQLRDTLASVPSRPPSNTGGGLDLNPVNDLTDWMGKVGKWL